MKEDCATGMSALHGCIDDKAVVETFKEALKERIGSDRFRMWFIHGVAFELRATTSGSPVVAPSGYELVILVSGQFALDRLRQNFLQPIRAAAAKACGTSLAVTIELGRPEPKQAALPLDIPESEIESELGEKNGEESHAKTKRKIVRANSPQREIVRSSAQPLASLIAGGSAATGKRTKRVRITAIDQPELPFENESTAQTEGTAKTPQSKPQFPRDLMTLSSFIGGSCNKLAHTAAMMACQNPGTATPLFLYGPSGIGKTHLVNAIADQFRRRFRMRSVVQLSGEKFTNDFCKSVGTSGLPAFRKRYREVDALLIDDVQFLSSKSATLREMLYTVEALIESGRPIIFTANQAPSEISGLSRELTGRMASGLVCPMHSLDTTTRDAVLRRLIAQRCPIEWPESMITEINSQLAGDGRVLSGIVNLVSTLQMMFDRMPSMDEIRQFGGDLLRVGQAAVTLSTIERTVCEAFRLSAEELRGSSQSRAVCEPRMLAMYLSRQLTSSAYAEIASHYGGRSHSTAIAAEKNVKKWMEAGKAIGRGTAAVSVKEAVDRIETILRTG